MIEYKNPMLSSRIYPKTMISSKNEMSFNKTVLSTIYHIFIVMFSAHWVRMNKIENSLWYGLAGVVFWGLLVYFFPRFSAFFLLCLKENCNNTQSKACLLKMGC